MPIWSLLRPQGASELCNRGVFRNRLVLIGPTAAVFQDLHLSAWSGQEGMPGVEIHATELANRLERRPLLVLPHSRLWSLLLGGFCFGLGLIIRRWERPLSRLGWCTAIAMGWLLLAVASKLLCGLGVSAADRRAGIDRWQVIFGLMPRGLPGLVFASTALAAGVINAVQFSALVLMVSTTTVVGLLLLEGRLQHQQKISRVHVIQPHSRFELPPVSDVKPVSWPPILKGYLNLNAKVCGPPAYDRVFHTADFLTMLDIEDLRPGFLHRFKR